jgi:ribonucleoside-triphosphate reductase (formate)
MIEKKVPVEVYSRVVGYYRPVNQWNRGKQEEYKGRYEYDPKEITKGLREETHV